MGGIYSFTAFADEPLFWEWARRGDDLSSLFRETTEETTEILKSG